MGLDTEDFVVSPLYSLGKPLRHNGVEKAGCIPFLGQLQQITIAERLMQQK